MKKLLTLTIVAIGLALGASGAWAQGPYPSAVTDGTFGPAGSVTPNSNTAEPVEVYNAINQLIGTSFTNNAQADYLEAPTDITEWQQTNNGGYAAISVGAGGVNTLQVYDVNTPGTLVNPIGGLTGQGYTGDGSVANPYIGAANVFAPGTNFGFALNNVSPSNVSSTFYLDPTLNADGYNHAIAYHLSSLAGQQIYVYDPNTNTETLATLKDPYLLAFEDTSMANNGGISDMDFNDLTVLVDGVAPVPEPITVALFGLGLVAMAAFGLRRKFALVK